MPYSFILWLSWKIAEHMTIVLSGQVKSAVEIEELPPSAWEVVASCVVRIGG